jgi:threonylcarbamoyladenosine tRNA methylthiotransferase MtaB
MSNTLSLHNDSKRLNPMVEKTVAFVTLGCKANALESSALADRFKDLGWQVLPSELPASLYIFNTCTVTEKADAEARRLIRKCKRQNPASRVAVTGCYAQVSPQTFKTMGGIDFIIGNNLKDSLADLIVNQFTNYYADLNDGPLIMVDDFEKSRELVSRIGSFAGIARTRGSLKIQDGCDYKCTYCIIWKGRGPSRCLSVEAVTQQVQHMVTEGFKDITITGINIGQYEANGTDLAGLLRHVYTQVGGDYQLRLSSLDPLEVTDDLMDAMKASNGKIAPHVHLSSQSAEDSVLKAMARRHHVKDLIYVCQRLEALMPHIAIGSDIIVGFPTETDEAFEASFQVLTSIPMHYLHVFRYSPRAGTPAAEMRPQVQDSIRKLRATRLIALADQKKQAFYERFIGKTLSMLCESLQADGSLDGITENYIRVKLSAQEVRQYHLEANQRVLVEIESVHHGEWVHARVVQEAPLTIK